MLQQTRVEAVIPYYHRFLRRFPDIRALARAEESDVLAAWSGLGYYSRARLLHRAAKQVEAAGTPGTLTELRALPGVGEYTAAAIGSIVLGLPVAAVDGNVLRVASRATNDAAEITRPETRRRLAEVAQGWLDPRRPGDFNQALMELGATICIPRSPACDRCPVTGLCEARKAGTQRQLPVKLKKNEIREIALQLVILRRGGKVLLRKRGAGEKRLADFWELPEREAGARGDAVLVGEFTHQIVNDRFRIGVWRAAAPAGRVPGARWFADNELESMPVSTITRKALRL